VRTFIPFGRAALMSAGRTLTGLEGGQPPKAARRGAALSSIIEIKLT
jgi:hypothetical protein